MFDDSATTNMISWEARYGGYPTQSCQSFSATKCRRWISVIVLKVRRSEFASHWTYMYVDTQRTRFVTQVLAYDIVR